MGKKEQAKLTAISARHRARQPTAFPGYASCMKMMHSHDHGTQEDGFHFLLPHVADYVPDLLTAFAAEEDHGLRCWLLELLGSARVPELLSFFVNIAQGDDASLREWAIIGLRQLNTKEARRMLFEMEES